MRKTLSTGRLALFAATGATALLAGTQIEARAQTLTNDPISASQDQLVGEGGDEVVVTARRRAENAQDVPIAISALSGEQLEQSGLSRITDIKRLVPSLQAITFNPRNTNLSVRGLGGNVSLSNDGFELGVGFYVDDVYYGRPGQSQFDLLDLDQLSVLRGPQGTLFGKNTTAGAVVVSTRAPTFDWEGAFQGTIGDYGLQQEQASISGPLIDDVLAFRATISNSARDGYLTNLHDGRDIDNSRALTERVQFLLHPNDRLKVRVIADYGSQAANCCVGVNAGTAFTRIDGTPLPNDFLARAARIGYTLPPINPSARLVDVDAPVRVEMWQGGLSSNVQYDFDHVSLTSITAYRWWDWKPQNDADGTSEPGIIQGRIIDKQRQFSQEFRIASTDNGPVDWVAGVYYFRQVVPGFATSHFGEDAAFLNLPPVLYPTPQAAALASAALDDYELFAYSNPITKSYAAFGQASWQVNDRLSLTAGLRYTDEQKHGTFNQSVVGGAPLSSFPTASQGFVTTIRSLVGGANAYTVDREDEDFSGLLSASYKLAPDVLAYASYSRGAKSGGLNLSNLPATVPRTVDPESVDDYEVGLKTQWLDDALTVNLAGFWTEISQYQSTFFDTTLLTTYIGNVGQVRSRGIELDSHLHVGGLNAYASATYDEAVFIDYREAPAPVEYTGLLPQSANFVDLSGRPIPGAPRWALSVGGEYQGRLPGRGGPLAFIGADYSYRSSTYATASDSNASIIGDYGLLNLRAGLRSDDGRTELSFWVHNLGDTLYFETLGAGNSGGSGLVTGILGAPQTLGVTLRRSFGG